MRGEREGKEERRKKGGEEEGVREEGINKGGGWLVQKMGREG